MWDILYGLGGGIRNGIFDSQQFITGSKEWAYGYDYFYVLLGCYIVSPFLSRIVKDKVLEVYFLICASVVCFIIPAFVDLQYVYDNCPRVYSVMRLLDNGMIFVPAGVTVLFVGGHYIDRIANKISKRCVFVIAVISLAVGQLKSVAYLLQGQCPGIINVMNYGRYYGGYVSVTTVFFSAGVLLFFRVIILQIPFSDNMESIIKSIGRKCTLVFIIHGCVTRIVLPYLPINWCASYSIESTVNTTVLFAVALGVSYIVGYVPIIKKIL